MNSDSRECLIYNRDTCEDEDLKKNVMHVELLFYSIVVLLNAKQSPRQHANKKSPINDAELMRSLDASTPEAIQDIFPKEK